MEASLFKHSHYIDWEHFVVLEDGHFKWHVEMFDRVYKFEQKRQNLILESAQEPASRLTPVSGSQAQGIRCHGLAWPFVLLNAPNVVKIFKGFVFAVGGPRPSTSPDGTFQNSWSGWTAGQQLLRSEGGAVVPPRFLGATCHQITDQIAPVLDVVFQKNLLFR